jgi:hypothetical protein
MALVPHDNCPSPGRLRVGIFCGPDGGLAAVADIAQCSVTERLRVGVVVLRGALGCLAGSLFDIFELGIKSSKLSIS